MLSQALSTCRSHRMLWSFILSHIRRIWWAYIDSKIMGFNGNGKGIPPTGCQKRRCTFVLKACFHWQGPCFVSINATMVHVNSNSCSFKIMCYFINQMQKASWQDMAFGLLMIISYIRYGLSFINSNPWWFDHFAIQNTTFHLGISSQKQWENCYDKYQYIIHILYKHIYHEKGVTMGWPQKNCG